ncbi:cupin domain-containing protein [Frankia sp. CNm7]|uniref:Cupin domain-containing protein n=1 Tax=Frankia nepalensis TaxID=1836974 RepID=A0A937RQ61_9ACTN|nr:cupin domain-containing protein [Frankia nepalensis]MBL7498861.1 cupin domain-containing protein [Frankia nepalensis]MBL7513693.1 cupin domain-containing protein [Frankia nepalensis]MBL7524158.1 cupin domain-containing protein [Frankia nepalensis]MBL7631359.1 cupin domain-containing protein [Frankia nepalensis]
MALECKVFRDVSTFETRGGLPYRVGITSETAGSTGISMHEVTIPPGGRARAHRHGGHESVLYVVSGEAEMWWGERLENCMKVGPGDLIYVPPGCPHVSVNRSATAAIVGVVARTEPTADETVVLMPELDSLVP